MYSMYINQKQEKSAVDEISPFLTVKYHREPPQSLKLKCAS